jgi:MoCo/4Fe-4S cofactor protein with predicted Tat translocation signal
MSEMSLLINTKRQAIRWHQHKDLSIDMNEQKKYWQSFGELANSEAYQKSIQDEFKDDPAAENEGLLNSVTPRRDFLKYLGFSTAAAALAASCETPVKKAIPFANKPEDIIPGVADFYATTYVQDGDVVSILAKVRDGRPIKVEGNELDTINGGGTSARVQASVLDLYDTARLRHPLINGKEVTLDAIDRTLAKELAGIGGKQVVVLTSTVTSPTTQEAINRFLAKYPGRHVTYDAVSYSALIQANELTYGKKAIPSYQFQKAATVVSLGADFLGTWLSPVEFSRQYALGKKIVEKAPTLNKHIHFDSILTVTGAAADERFLHRPSEQGAVAVALLGAVRGEAVSIGDAKLKAGIEKAAKELMAKPGTGLVVSGSNDVNVQVVVNAINEAIGANGTTIDWSVTNNTRKGVDGDFIQLVKDIKANQVGALLIYGANPVYTWFEKDLAQAIKTIPVTVSFSGKKDETAQVAKYVVPDHHYLESWGDAEPKTGHFSFIQPTINPLFKTRQWQDSLLIWAGVNTTAPVTTTTIVDTVNKADSTTREINPHAAAATAAVATPYFSFLKTYWTGKLGGEGAWDKVLQDGVIMPAAGAAAGAAFNAGGVDAAKAAIAAVPKGGATELVLYQKIGIGEGQGASNPWLQELPDPITKATWDNYVIVSPAMAKTLLKIDLSNGGQADDYEVQPPKHVVQVKMGNTIVKLPALIIPGVHPNTVAIAVGYGRTTEIGKAATFKGESMGANAYPFANIPQGSATVSYYAPSVEVSDTGDKFAVALTQTHNTYDTAQGKRTEVVKEITLAEYIAHPEEILEEREKELKPWGGVDSFDVKGTLYPNRHLEQPGVKWGMSIDLNSCTGCGACVVACHIENNVPIVGKNQVMKYHDMHWLRIDRYYSGDAENPDVVFQPMLCQHCDNAPCENVCPVAATPHSSEGLNMMTYNRCIGTRYCANNCPYKVRRFNWLDYTGADSFPDNQKPLVEEGELDDVVLMMNDDLTRMVLNPDVTVRSRGVMEKCTFCVQRLQDGKLKAKKEGRPLHTGGESNNWDVKAACQQACASGCITFGNVHDLGSEVSLSRKENKNRLFYVIEQVHTLPNVSYLAKVRNSPAEGHAHAEGQHTDTEHAAEGDAQHKTHGQDEQAPAPAHH